VKSGITSATITASTSTQGLLQSRQNDSTRRLVLSVVLRGASSAIAEA
jgi:hypothetical protein